MVAISYTGLWLAAGRVSSKQTTGEVVREIVFFNWLGELNEKAKKFKQFRGPSWSELQSIWSTILLKKSLLGAWALWIRQGSLFLKYHIAKIFLASLVQARFLSQSWSFVFVTEEGWGWGKINLEPMLMSSFSFEAKRKLWFCILFRRNNCWHVDYREKKNRRLNVLSPALYQKKSFRSDEGQGLKCSISRLFSLKDLPTT